MAGLDVFKKKRNCSSPAEFLNSAIITIIKQKMDGGGGVKRHFKLLQFCAKCTLIILLFLAQSATKLFLLSLPPPPPPHCYPPPLPLFQVCIASLPLSDDGRSKGATQDRAALEGLILIAQNIVTQSTEQHD